MMKWCVLILSLFGLSWLQVGTSFAQERRIALVVVNQRGWVKDPLLRYAVEGDLRPLSRELRRLGFEVFEVINQAPEGLRKVMRRLRRRMLVERGVSTFLFYYSGHADRTQLHMGPDKKGNFTYKEFLTFFQSVPSQRRFAIFDACFSGEIIRLFGSLTRYKKLLREGRLKGVRRRSSINISRLKFPNQGQEQGIRIIASSLQMSWELNRYRASVFTYHLLRGIRGEADLDKDGKISVDELFDFTSREVKQITGQKPQQLIVTHRAHPYAFAPAYRSRLRIGAEVTGTLKVSVANFLWSHQKLHRKPLTLSLVHGEGWVGLQRAKRCWRQPVSLPKGGELRLGGRWDSVPCRGKFALRQKGMLALPARIAPLDLTDPSRSLGLSAGLALQGAGSLLRAQPSLSLAFQWRWFQADLGFSHGFSGGQSFSLSRLFLQTAVGLPLSWSWLEQDLRGFLGGFVRGGLVMQHLSSSSTALNLHGVAGALAQFSWWWGGWGLRLELSGGVDATPTSGGVIVSPFGQLSTALVWAI